jgi:hypothetical protein
MSRLKGSKNKPKSVTIDTSLGEIKIETVKDLPTKQEALEQIRKES